MIELNCSYEESKKIFELGYDFSKVGMEFENKNQICTFNKTLSTVKIKVNEDVFIDRDVNTGSFDEAYPVRGITAKSLLFYDYVPIIPKAALEKCLPEFLDVTDFYGELNRSRFVKRLCNGMIGLKSQDSDNFFHIWFISAFEAFIWCHENYPEELKRKFDEVMG